ncbi:hypothetical protein [Streptomyces sp. NPDC089799]|uniref:hypothetical protein n=1 Tax=Streptomyces sp. NPDC089799 TaxID=3155066 RepID=UPI0034175AD0
MDPELGAGRIGVGLTVIVSGKLDRPEFHGATHGVLGIATVRDCVAQAALRSSRADLPPSQRGRCTPSPTQG